MAAGAVAPDPRVFLLPLSALLLDQTLLLLLATNNFAFGQFLPKTLGGGGICCAKNCF